VTYRVVASDGTMGGFSGQWGSGERIDRKEKLLQSEGVTFSENRVIPKECMITEIPGHKTNNPQDLERQKKTQEMANHIPVKERKHHMVPLKKNHTQKRNSKVKKEIHNSVSNQKGTVPMDEELRNVVIYMARERGTSKTC
jgi:hypothetical protein